VANRVRNYKAEYARRIERGLKSGKTRQTARGHIVREHIERREREIEQFGLSTAQMRSITNWTERRTAQIHDATLDAEAVIDMARSEGYEWFVNYRDTWNEIRRNYKREQHNGTWASRGLGFLEAMASIVSVEDISWLYYH
jgi:hypothetical protein